MSFKMTLAGAALTLSMAPLAARADDFSQQQYQDQQPYEQQYQYQQPYEQQYQQQPQYDQQYQQPAYPQQQPGIAVGEPCPTDRQGDRSGRYEQRVMQRWMPAQYQQVWVPEQCSIRFRQRGWYRQVANVCVPAHYDQRWAPGHYESVQQWVWVPFGFHNHHRFGGGFYGRGI